jgi:hypothetical protein
MILRKQGLNYFLEDRFEKNRKMQLHPNRVFDDLNETYSEHQSLSGLVYLNVCQIVYLFIREYYHKT